MLQTILSIHVTAFFIHAIWCINKRTNSIKLAMEEHKEFIRQKHVSRQDSISKLELAKIQLNAIKPMNLNWSNANDIFGVQDLLYF